MIRGDEKPLARRAPRSFRLGISSLPGASSCYHMRTLTPLAKHPNYTAARNRAVQETP